MLQPSAGAGVRFDGSPPSPNDVSADGQRFLINTALEAEGPRPITVVMNWARGN